MKNLFFLLSCFILISCNKDKITTPTDDPNTPTVLKFANETLNVGKNGGTFSVKLEANKTVKIVPSAQKQNRGVKPDIYNRINVQEQKLSTNEITLRIGASNGVLMADSTITITTPDGKDSATVVIVQEGNPEMISQDEKLKNFSTYLLAEAAHTFDLFYSVEAFYTKVTYQSWPWSTEFYQKPVSVNSPVILEMWARSYRTIRNTNLLINEKGIPDSLKASIVTLRSILYYQLALLWQNVPYVATYEIQFYPSQMAYDELLNQLSDAFRESKAMLKNKKNDTGWIFSADLAAQMQAKVLMAQKKYAEAFILLDDIIKSNRYRLLPNRNAALKKINSELIQGIFSPTGGVVPYSAIYNQLYANAEIISISRFSETVMLAAECNLKMGDNAKVASLLNMIESARGRAPKYTSPILVTMNDLQQTWLTELYGEFSYFDFLKRNNIAESVLNIQTYQKVLPIPMQELLLNPNIKQNSEY